MRFPDASNFYAERSDGNIVYPNGSGQSPTAEGSGSNGWFKVYLSGTTNWTWSTRTSDNDPHEIYVQFDTPGNYTMEISGRSKDHLIDRITLSNNASDPLDLNNMETPCNDGTLSLNEIEDDIVMIFPNPSQDYITIDLGKNITLQNLEIFDINGKRIENLKINNNILDISKLETGVYFGQIRKGKRFKFIKK